MKAWHYLLAGYVGAFVWSLLAGIGGLFWGSSEFPISKQITLLIIGIPISALVGSVYGFVFKLIEPYFGRIPRLTSAIIFWDSTVIVIAVMTQQLNLYDFRFYIGFVLATLAGLSFEKVLSVLQKKTC